MFKKKAVLNSKCREQRLKNLEMTLRDINPQEFRDLADQSVGAEEDDSMTIWQGPMKLVVEGL